MRGWSVILPVFLLLCGCQSTRTALKAMQDHTWEKAETILQKQLLSKKDSLFPEVYYAYSLLYTDTAYQHHQLDTAYQYIIQATHDYHQIPEKEKQKLARSQSLDDSTLLLQKRRLDSLAFVHAQNLSTVTEYQHFIDQHTDAPQQEEAILLRDQLAFEAASQLDTYQAYREFIDTYPNAQQVPQAEERYNTLVFQSQTATGDLQSYYQFLEAFPNSPYRLQAEQAIFRISTAANQLSSYSQFANNFPESPFARQAVDWLYYLYKTSHPADSFFIQYPNIPYADSLQKANRIEQVFLLPWLSQGQFGFMNAEGQNSIKPQFNDVLPEYICKGVQSNVIFATSDSVLQMQSKKGDLLYTMPLATNEFPAINDLGSGLVWIKAESSGAESSGAEPSGELIHKSGKVVIPVSENVSEVSLMLSPEATDKLLPPFQFIKFKVAGQWGLKSFSGVTLLSPEYDDIQEHNHFITLEKDNRLAVTNRTTVAKQAIEESIKPNFQYEDVTLLDNYHLVAYTRQYEAVLDTALQTIVPLGRYTVLRQVHQTPSTWLLKTTEEQQMVRNDSLITQKTTRYSIYPFATEDEAPTFSQVFYNDQWLALKSDQHYFLLDQQTPTFPTTSYDSIKIVSDHFAVIFHGSQQSLDSVDLLVANQKPISVPFSKATVRAGDLQFRLIRTQDVQSPTEIKESLLIRQPNRPELLLSQTGDTVLEASLESVSAYPNGLYVIEQRGKQGVVDEAGNELVPVQYDRIGSYQSPGLLSVFHRQKFGLYHAPASMLIKPVYEAALQLYGIVVRDTIPTPLYIARKGGKYGIIDGEEQLYLPFSFQAVRFWNDTSALVRYDDQWLIYPLAKELKGRLSFQEDSALYSGIEEFTPLSASSSEMLIKIYKNGGYGVLSNQQGELLSPTFDDILPIQNPEDKVTMYLTEKYVSEAKLHILIHMNAQGEIIRREAYSPDEYDRLYCDQ